MPDLLALLKTGNLKPTKKMTEDEANAKLAELVRHLRAFFAAVAKRHAAGDLDRFELVATRDGQGRHFSIVQHLPRGNLTFHGTRTQ